MKKRLMRVIRGEEGASMVEYALLVALIAVVAITAVQLVGTNVTAVFNGIAGRLLGIG